MVNGSADHHGSDGLCPEHLGNCLHNGKEAAIILDRNGGLVRRGSECYPMNEFRTPIAGNPNPNSNCPSLNNSSCDSKSNLLLMNGALAQSNGDHLGNATGTSPRHLVHTTNYQQQDQQQ